MPSRPRRQPRCPPPQLRFSRQTIITHTPSLIPNPRSTSKFPQPRNDALLIKIADLRPRPHFLFSSTREVEDSSPWTPQTPTLNEKAVSLGVKPEEVSADEPDGVDDGSEEEEGVGESLAYMSVRKIEWEGYKETNPLIVICCHTFIVVLAISEEVFLPRLRLFRNIRLRCLQERRPI